MKKIMTEDIELYRMYLVNDEKAAATVEKYLRDVSKLKIWLGERELCKAAVLEYKAYLCECFAPASVNAALSSLI